MCCFYHEFKALLYTMALWYKSVSFFCCSNKQVTFVQVLLATQKLIKSLQDQRLLLAKWTHPKILMLIIVFQALGLQGQPWRAQDCTYDLWICDSLAHFYFAQNNFFHFFQNPKKGHKILSLWISFLPKK